MAYQSMAATDGMPLLREKGTVEVVDEGAGSVDEVDGSRVNTIASRRGRRGAALSLLVLAVGAISALSAMGGRSSPQSECFVHLSVLARGTRGWDRVKLPAYFRSRFGSILGDLFVPK